MNRCPSQRSAVSLVLAGFALCAGFSAHAQAPEPVSMATQEIVDLVKGKSISTQNTRWGAVRLQFRDDGSLYGSNNGGTDSGKWRVADGKLCLQWRRWDYDGCGLVQKAGAEVRHLWPDGNVHFVYKP